MDQLTSRQDAGKEIALPGLALIQTLLNPDFVKVEETLTPPENTRRSVHVYTWINKEYMKIDFFDSIREYTRKHKRN